MDEESLVEPGVQDAFAAENALLRQRNALLEASMRAIRDGETDALRIAGAGGDRLLTLDGANHAYRLLVEEMGEGAVTLTPTGVVAYANRRFAEMLSRPLEQVIGSRITGCFAPEGREAVFALLRDGPLSKRSAEADLLTEAGNRVPTLLSARRLVIEGLPDAVCMVVTDLTVQKLGEVAIQTRQTLLNVMGERARADEARAHAERAISASEARYRMLFEYAPDGILIADAEGRYLDANASICRMLGYDRSELIGLESAAVVSMSEVPHIAGALSEIGSNADHRREWNFRRRDGSHFAGDVLATRMPGGNVLAMVHDTTEQRRSEARMRRLVDSNVQGVIFWNLDGEIMQANDAFLEMVGYSREDLESGALDWAAMTPPEYEEVDRKALEEISVHGACKPIEKSFIRKDGSRVPVMAGAAIFEGAPTEGVCFVIDISDRKEYERTLREASVKAEAGSLAKSEFLANMSHEIRTPMNAVIGLSYLLAQTSLDHDQMDILDKVKLASKSLLMVINNVLDLSKIEAGELIVERVGFYLRDQLNDLSNVATVQADAKGIGFELVAPEDLPEALEGDPTRLSQILTNLLSNAVKFTAIGGVKLKVQVLASTAEHVTLSFAVQDTGIGIAPEEQARLFEPFAQADASITRRFGGTGLGLSIVKRLAALLEGQVSLASTAGAGCEFKLVLQFQLASSQTLALLQASPARPAAHALLGVRVLVVDDSDINLDVTKRILEVAGAQVWLAGNGREALDFLVTESRAVDIVLMDVQMPVLDGHDATRLIRLDPRLANLPIIALSAGALSSEQQKAAAAGMDGYIVKPFEAHGLVNSILQRLRRDGRAVADLRPPELEAHAWKPTQAWPQIQGIDTLDVRERLSDDFELFRSMLKRLLEEFAGDDSPENPTAPATLPVLAARMHKLKGSAGMLGAKALQELARQAEVACAAGAPDRAARLTSRIASQLRQLRRSVATTLTPAPRGSIVPAPERREVHPQETAGEPDPGVLADLIGALDRHDLSAVRQFGLLSPGLRRMVPPDSFDMMRDHIDNLRFSEAAHLLRRVRPPR